MATQKQFQLEYPRFVQQYGVLYEKTELPMTETDRRKTRQFYWAILFFIVLFSIIGGVTYYFNADKGITSGLILFVGLALLIIGYSYYYLTKTLKLDKKVLIRTVVTGKRSRKGFEIELSGQRYINVSTHDYDMLDFGDIIQVEKVGMSITFTQTISRLGSIFDVDSIQKAQ